MKVQSFCRVLLFAVLLLFVAGCAAPEPTATPVPPTATPAPPTATPIPPTPEPVDGLVDVGGFEMYIKCSGQGEPVVIMDAIMQESGSEWHNVMNNVKGKTRACYFDRAGNGRSDPSPKSLRSSADMAEELHTLLHNAGVEGPYIMAGHHMAGFNALAFARLYPEEVAGLVLVDGFVPGQMSMLVEILEEMGEEFCAEVCDVGPEGRWALLQSEADAAVDSLGDRPLALVMSTEPPPPDGVEFWEKTELRKKELWDKTLALSSRSSLQMLEGNMVWEALAVHYLTVAEAILQVVEQAREG